MSVIDIEFSHLGAVPDALYLPCFVFLFLGSDILVFHSQLRESFMPFLGTGLSYHLVMEIESMKETYLV